MDWNTMEHVFSTEGLAYSFQSAFHFPSFDFGEGLPHLRQDLPTSPPPYTSGLMFDGIGGVYTNQDQTLAAYPEFIGKFDTQYNRYDGDTTGFIAIKGADGAWTRVTDFGSHSSVDPYGFDPSVLGINNLNQILVTTGTNALDADPKPHVELYDASSSTLLDLTRMLADRWTIGSRYVSLDESGRILLVGQAVGDEGGGTHVLLLTPDGVPIDPKPVPEPSTIAFIACAAIGYAARRSRSARRSA
jgi:hypothetical protein